MGMDMAKASSLVCVEALESRELLSDTISFADWTQMVSPGAWWEYQTEYSAGGVSGSCTEKIQVANALANIGGTKCALVSSGYGKSKTRTAYFASDQGTFEKQVVLSSGGIGEKAFRLKTEGCQF